MIVGVVLAGGRSRRMGGGDKFLREVAGRRMLDHTLARLVAQVDQVILSANGNEHNLIGCSLPIVDDGAYAGSGPLAGILAALRWGAARFGSDTVLVSVPADTPFFPFDLAERLVGALARNADIAVASSNGRRHYAVAAWSVRAADAIEDQLKRGETLAIRDFLQSCTTETVDFAGRPHDPFFNVNTPLDLEAAQAIASELMRRPLTGMATRQSDTSAIIGYSKRFARPAP